MSLYRYINIKESYLKVALCPLNVPLKV
jgi:hypothetical protein